MFDEQFSAFTVEDGAGPAEMQGPSSAVNQMVGRVPWRASGARSLVVLWFVVLAIYWLLGALFRGKSSVVK